MYDELTQRGYWVTPQVRVGQYRIDMVVEGHNDARLAIECDGDKYHGADKWADDMQRQRVLERAGWVFWRCFASAFIRRREEVMGDLLKTFAERNIQPIGAEGAPRSVHSEHRVVISVPETVDEDDLTRRDDSESITVSTLDAVPVPGADAHPMHAPFQPSTTDSGHLAKDLRPLLSATPRGTSLLFADYSPYVGSDGHDPRVASLSSVSDGLFRIIEIEGPIIVKRAYDIFLRSCGIKRMGHELKSTMNKVLSDGIRQGKVVAENEAGRSGLLFSVVRVTGSPPIKLRRRGPRSFEEIPPSELQVVAMYLAEREGYSSGSDEHLRAVLESFDLKRLTTQVGTTLLEILEMRFPYMDEFVNQILK